jgi:hypothetical protein
MDASGRRGSKGDPSSSGAEDDRVSGAKVFSCAAPSAHFAARSLGWPHLLTFCILCFVAGSWRRIWPQPGCSSWQVCLHTGPPCGLRSSTHHCSWLAVYPAHPSMHACVAPLTFICHLFCCAVHCKASYASLVPTLRTCYQWVSVVPG